MQYFCLVKIKIGIWALKPNIQNRRNHLSLNPTVGVQFDAKMRIVKITRKKSELAERNFDLHLAHNAAFSDAAALNTSTQMLRTIAGLPCLCEVANFLKLFRAISQETRAKRLQNVPSRDCPSRHWWNGSHAGPWLPSTSPSLLFAVALPSHPVLAVYFPPCSYFLVNNSPQKRFFQPLPGIRIHHIHTKERIAIPIFNLQGGSLHTLSRQPTPSQPYSLALKSVL